MNHTREHDSKGIIVGYVPAQGYDSSAECTLELTDIPQYSVVELVINKYVLPSDYGCPCKSNGTSSCNHITVTISNNNNNNRFCSPTTDPVYMYKSDKNFIRIVSTRNTRNYAVDFNLTYRGECYNSTIVIKNIYIYMQL